MMAAIKADSVTIDGTNIIGANNGNKSNDSEKGLKTMVIHSVMAPSATNVQDISIADLRFLSPVSLAARVFTSLSGLSF